MIIDYRQVSEQALQGVIESFVQREGTDYGEQVYSLQQKVAHVKQQLIDGQVSLVFDAATESVNVLTRDQIAVLETE